MEGDRHERLLKHLEIDDDKRGGPTVFLVNYRRNKIIDLITSFIKKEHYKIGVKHGSYIT